MYFSVLLALAAACLATPVQQASGRIHLPTGQYEGLHDCNTSTTVYYGIPFAFAPRFQPPSPIEDRPGINPNAHVNASTHGPACVNFNLPPPYDTGYQSLLGSSAVRPQKEDCLNLDIYVPDGNHKGLPVLFYTPGGGFLVGASYPYDMRPLLSKATELGKPFIAVAINYRLGPLGVLNPSTLEDMNVAILDQFQALGYVQRHISAFGGDPKKVTIMGESAGAESTMHQLLWDSNVFRAAWMMSVPSSDAPFLQIQKRTKDELVQSYAEACGCAANKSVAENVACLNTTDVSTLVNQSTAWEGSGTSLGGVLKQNVFSTLRQGKFPKVPIVVSTCRDEGTSAAIGWNSSSDQVTAYAIQVLVNGGHRLNESQGAQFQKEMLKAYPNDPAVGCPYDGKNTTYGQTSQFKRMASIMTDSMYTEAWTEYLDIFSPSKVWGILFDEPIPGTEAAFGVQHGSDLAFYFPTLLGPDNDPRKLGMGKLVDTIHESITHFVNDLAPTSSSYDWPMYANTKKVTQLSAQGPVAIDPPRRPGFPILRKYLRPNGFDG